MGTTLCAIDIGSSKIRAAICEIDENGKLVISAISEAQSEGVSNSIIDNPERAGKVIRDLVNEVEVKAGVEVSDIIASIGGTHIVSKNSEGGVSVIGKDNEISNEDIRRSLDLAKASSITAGMNLIHVLVQNFVIDGRPDIKDPLSMLGHRLDTKVLLILGSESVSINLKRCIERGSSYHLQTTILKQVADGEAVVDSTSKDMGCIIINIGSDTTHLIAYGNGSPIFTTAVNMGSANVTSDISIIFNRPKMMSEQIKIRDGSCYTPSIGMDETCILPAYTDSVAIEIPKIELAKVIEARMGEIFSHLKLELTKQKLNYNFGSGIYLVGNGARLRGTPELATEIFELNARLGFVQALAGLDREYLNPEYATLMGLLIYESRKYKNKKDNPKMKSKTKSRFKRFIETIF